MEPVAERTHFLSAAIAKYVFQHDRHGIVFSRTPIRLADAARYGLSPVILYAVTAAGTSIRSLSFAPCDAPLSLCSVLQRAWRDARGLRGYPDTLRISRFVADASPGLAGSLTRANVRVEVAKGTDRQFGAALRSAQDSVLDLGWFVPKGMRIATLADLQANADSRHLRSSISDSTSLMILHPPTRSRTESLLALPDRSFDFNPPGGMDWTPGDWLSGWEGNVPPSGPRYFRDAKDSVWFFDGYPESADEDGVLDAEDEEMDNAEEDDDDDGTDTTDYLPVDSSVENIRHILGCWPNKPGEVARAIGVTAKVLKWYAAGRAGIDGLEHARLLSLFGIESDPDGFYESNGPCVLVASSVKSAMDAYDDLAHGGDLRLSVEAVPTSAPADPSWRFLLFQSHAGYLNVFMIPRGGPVSEKLDANRFINFGGTVKVPDGLYREIVATCARACKEPFANRRELREFERRHRDLLEQLEEQYRLR